jgi:hypothetical protein
MPLSPIFPTKLHQNVAELTRDFFTNISIVDTVLVVNSCARGHAVPESDLDFAILVNADASPTAIKNIERSWTNFSDLHPTFIKYKGSGPYAHLHLDIINGLYLPGPMEYGGDPDYFEIEIGNQLNYSAPMGNAGPYFIQLQRKWLPYYNHELQFNRLLMTQTMCEYDLDQIPFYIKRGLYFQAFDRLYIAFQKFLQALFISNRIYPISYKKWIKFQLTEWLKIPELYPKLSPIISITNIESDEINEKARNLKDLMSVILAKKITNMYQYDTVLDALNDLKKRGYTYDFNLKGNEMYCNGLNKAYSPKHLKAKEVYRFEGPSDPDEEAVVFAIETDDGIKGSFVSAFGTYADAESKIFMDSIQMDEN